MARLSDMLHRLRTRRRRTASSVNKTLNRRLAFERLEDRRVLSAASIAGSVFDDGALGISNVTVQLSGDGPDGVAAQAVASGCPASVPGKAARRGLEAPYPGIGGQPEVPAAILVNPADPQLAEV